MALAGSPGSGSRIVESRALDRAAVLGLEHGKEALPDTPLGAVALPGGSGHVGVWLVRDGGGLSYLCRSSWDGREVHVPVGSDRKDGQAWLEVAMAAARDLAESRGVGS